MMMVALLHVVDGRARCRRVHATGRGKELGGREQVQEPQALGYYASAHGGCLCCGWLCVGVWCVGVEAEEWKKARKEGAMKASMTCWVWAWRVQKTCLA